VRAPGGVIAAILWDVPALTRWTHFMKVENVDLPAFFDSLIFLTLLWASGIVQDDQDIIQTSIIVAKSISLNSYLRARDQVKPHNVGCQLVSTLCIILSLHTSHARTLLELQNLNLLLRYYSQ
jgi:hypothetical protein